MRGKGHDALETESVIRRKALELFAEKGFHATSARDIADRVGTSVSHLYYYFPSKSHVLTSVMTVIVEDLLAELARALAESEENAVARLTAIVRTYVIFHSRRRAEAFVGRSELRSLSAGDRPNVVALYDRVTAIFNDVIADGIRQRAFTCPYRMQATSAITAMCSGVSTWYRKDGPLTPETIATRYAYLALQMVGYESP